MSETGSSTWGRIAVIVVALLVGGALIWNRDTLKQARRVSARVQVMQLRIAVLAFEKEYGSFPKGDAVAIMAALRGNSDRRVIFFEAPAHSFNDKGEIVDPWGGTHSFRSEHSWAASHLVDGPESPGGERRGRL
jgi:hypothetical protein